MEIQEALAATGLSEKEINVYLACLRLGSSSVNRISKEAGTFRTYTYDILKTLAEKGLVHSVTSGKTQLFEATDPMRVVELLEERADKVREIVPKLQKIKSSVTQKPSVELYEGLAGVNAIHDLILREKPKEICVFGNPKKHYEVMNFYLPRFVEARVKKKIKARVIITKTDIGIEWMKKKGAREVRETRFFKGDVKEFPAVTYIWNDRVAHFTIEKTIIAVLIKDKHIATAQQAVFDNLWRSVR